MSKIPDPGPNVGITRNGVTLISVSTRELLGNLVMSHYLSSGTRERAYRESIKLGVEEWKAERLWMARSLSVGTAKRQFTFSLSDARIVADVWRDVVGDAPCSSPELALKTPWCWLIDAVERDANVSTNRRAFKALRNIDRGAREVLVVAPTHLELDPRRAHA